MYLLLQYRFSHRHGYDWQFSSYYVNSTTELSVKAKRFISSHFNACFKNNHVELLCYAQHLLK